jgi:hypothetical protein
MSRKTRPVICRRDGASNGTPAAPAFRTRAGATAVKSGTPALDEKQAPRVPPPRFRNSRWLLHKGELAAPVARSPRSSGRRLAFVEDACFDGKSVQAPRVERE